MASRLSLLCALAMLGIASLYGCGGEAVAAGDTQAPAPEAGTKEGGGKADQADCPSDLMNAEGLPCSSPSAVCGKCPEDPCQYCNLLGCMGGTWTWLEASPDPSCFDDAGNAGCPADLAAAEGTACSSPSTVCGTCPDDHCQYCNLLGCMGGTWQTIEAFPDPSCGQDGGKPDTGPKCGAVACKPGQYCYHTGCGVDGCTPPEPECFDLPPGCASCECAKPFPSCTCDKVDGGFSIDCPAG